MITNCAALILAGGKSERMVFPKPFLPVNGKTFLNKIVTEYSDAGIKNIFIVLNDEYCIGAWESCINRVKQFAIVIENPEPEKGRFHSIKLGAEKIKYAEFCFVQNVDNPSVNKNIIAEIFEQRNSSGYTVPVYNGMRGHPVLISKKIIRHINLLPDEDFNLREILNNFPAKEVEINDERILLNINTTEDYKKFIHQKTTA